MSKSHCTHLPTPPSLLTGKNPHPDLIVHHPPSRSSVLENHNRTSTNPAIQTPANGDKQSTRKSHSHNSHATTNHPISHPDPPLPINQKKSPVSVSFSIVCRHTHTPLATLLAPERSRRVNQQERSTKHSSQTNQPRLKHYKTLN
jgi:hypothetical protein